MPIKLPHFGKKKRDDSKENLAYAESKCDSSSVSTSNGSSAPSYMRKPKFSFQCQLAHGSPTGLISGFTNIMELYSKIANCYEISQDDILFCTLNTHKVDMDNLLGAHLGLDDFIFVHVKGQKKEVDVIKKDESLGLTITDNGAGKAIIKRLRENSQLQEMVSQGFIGIGDHIEKIDDESFVGKRHYDVAKKLRSISIGQKFTIRLISPERSSIYSNISLRSEYKTNHGTIGSGRKTIRFTSSGIIEEDETSSNSDDLAIEIITRYVEKALGISDNEMAQTIFEIGKRSKNPNDFAEYMDEELGDFQFSTCLINDFWGVVTDAKAGILTSGRESVTTSSTRLTGAPSEYSTIVYEDRF